MSEDTGNRIESMSSTYSNSFPNDDHTHNSGSQNAEMSNNVEMGTESRPQSTEPDASKRPPIDDSSLPPAYASGFGDGQGAPSRVWLNENVTPSLVQAMRTITKERPEKPLRRLADLLLQYADLIESADGDGSTNNPQV